MSRPGFFFLVCPDGALCKQRIESLLQQHPPEGGGGMLGSSGPPQWERKVFWGDDGLDDAFWQTVTQNDLFGRPRAVIVRNAQNLLKEHWEQLSAPLARFNAQVWPFFCIEKELRFGKPEVPAVIKKRKYFVFAEKQGWVWQSPGLGESGVRTWLQDWAKSRGFSFGPGALQAILECMPQDASAVTSELAKLELALEPGAQIGPELAQLLSHIPDIDIFTFINALQNSSAAGMVWQKVLAHRQSGQGFLFQFLALLVREARILWQLLHQEQVGRMPPKQMQAKQQLSQKLGGRRIARIWDLALEAELRVKTGEAGEEQALEMLVAELTRLFSPPAAFAQHATRA